MITRARARQMAAAEGNNPPLKKFTGYNDVAPAVWLEKYAIFANLKGWNPQQTLNNVGLYLGDGPYTWYRGLPNGTKQNLALLQAAFNEKYVQHDGLTWALRAQLSERKQRESETVEDYAEDIERRCGQLAINGQQMVEAFIRGLRPNVRAAVIKDQPANLTAAINSARVAQSLSVPETHGIAEALKTVIAEQMKIVKEELAALTVNTASPAPSRSQYTHERPAQRLYQHQQQQPSHQQQYQPWKQRQRQQYQQQQQPYQQQQQYQPRGQQQQQHYQPWQPQQQQYQQACYRCGRFDHIPNNCFARNVNCHYCGNLGHLIRMCKEKQNSQ